MLSPIQFHSLLVAAWFGPTLEAATCSTGGAPGAWSYQASYFLSGWQSATATRPTTGFFSAAGEQCPFSAISAALVLAWEGGRLEGWQLRSGQAVVAQAVQEFSGAPAPAAAPAIVCASCQCDSTTDPFGMGCDCIWASLPRTAGAHV